MMRKAEYDDHTPKSHNARTRRLRPPHRAREESASSKPPPDADLGGGPGPDKLGIDADLLREEMEKDQIRPSDLPPEVHPAKGVVDLRHLIWRPIHEKDLTEKEETEIKELIRLLKAKESRDEVWLKEERLTSEEAHRLYEETAAVIRTLMDLKEIQEKKENKTEVGREAVKKKVNDVKRRNAFVDEMKGKKRREVLSVERGAQYRAR